MTIPWRPTPARLTRLRALGVRAAPDPARPDWTQLPDVTLCRWDPFSRHGPAWLACCGPSVSVTLVLPETGDPYWLVPAPTDQAG